MGVNNSKMKRIDKLLLKAKKVYGANSKHVSFGMIEPIFKEGNTSEVKLWEATTVLWDGLEGSCTKDDYIKSYHDTKEAAESAIMSMAKERNTGNEKDVTILLVDFASNKEE